MSKDRDTELISDCRRGDRNALETLVRRYEKPIYNVAYRMLGNPDDAADITQIAFLKVFENLDRYNPKFKFFSWIYRIAVNESINLLKRRGHLEPFDDRQASNLRDPEEMVEAERLCNCVQEVLMELQEEYRAVIVLRHFTECSYHEIGEILQIPDKTVKSRLYTARQIMKDKLSAKGLVGK
ncbi:MAG: sigma-70 family RNA polymerase sigma factor [Proteobacteria bacterium]|nr:sigma-70 family RNA polymerase sigma factor [Pseudomonadota bacterium]